ncbi:MAG: hypothetical protein Q8O40_15230 [Chloroflexota bacterium]|nr:hypothetical protein [Chloroflexota bacterium]
MNRAKKRRQFRWLAAHRLAQYQKAFDTMDPDYIRRRWEKLAEVANKGRRHR